MVTSLSHRGSGVACIRFTAKLMVSTSSKYVGTQYKPRVRMLLVHSNMLPLWPRLAAYPCLDLPSLLLERSTKYSNPCQQWFADVSFYLFLSRLGLSDDAAAPESVPSTTKLERGSTCLRWVSGEAGRGGARNKMVKGEC